jgi:hypothetical protein
METEQRVAGLEEAVHRLQQENTSLQSHALSLQTQLQQVAKQTGATPHSLSQSPPPSLDSLVSAAVLGSPQSPSLCQHLRADEHPLELTWQSRRCQVLQHPIVA